MNTIKEFKENIKRTFNEFESILDGKKDSIIHQERINALTSFEEVNFPSENKEDWRFTNVSPLFLHNFKPSSKGTHLDRDKINSVLQKNPNNINFFFINGVLDESISELDKLPSSIKLTKSSDSGSQDTLKFANGLLLLNKAFLVQSYLLEVSKNFVFEDSINLIYVNSSETDILVQPNLSFRLNKNSQVNITEHYLSLGNTTSLTNTVLNFQLKENSKINYVKLQEENKESFHFANIKANLDSNAKFDFHLINLGGKIARNEVYVKLDGEGAEAWLNGLYMTSDNQLSDVQTIVDHNKPNCNSYEHFKGLLDDRSHAVFNGKIFVRQDAQKTNAFQENNNLLLSLDALVNTKPQLEIFADDVKCSHGATVGQLDEEQMFYLQSRGISVEQGRIILMHAFASEIIKLLKVQEIKDYIEEILTNKFK